MTNGDRARPDLRFSWEERVKNKRRIWGHKCQDESFSQVSSTTGRGGEGKGQLTPARLDAADSWGRDSGGS